jgi:hypothetical protein
VLTELFQQRGWQLTIRKAAWQLLREQLIPFVVAGAVTLLVWAFVNEEGQGWTLATRLGALGPWAGFLAGAAAGWHRIRSGQKTSQTLSTIETNVRQVLADFDVRMADAVGHITGGDAVPYLWGLPDSAGTENSPRVTVLGGKHSQRDVVMLIDELPFASTSPPVRSTQVMLGLVVAGHSLALSPTILDHQTSDRRRLLITFVGLNGTSRQILRLAKVNGQWTSAIRLLGHGKVLCGYVGKGYPDQPDWIEDMDLLRRHLGVVLGGEPYDPLGCAQATTAQGS